jgi:peptidoglycan/LPS O-acetylase OafA/YrhL
MYSRSKLLFLNGIRGLSALWVFAGHCAQRINFHLHYLDSPSIAVDIFMLMSGFLMYYHYSMEDISDLNLKNVLANKKTISFYLRRFFRIAPLYYILLIPALFFQENYRLAEEEIKSYYPTTLDFNYPSSDPLNILLHLTFLFGLVPKFSASNVIPDWSIGLEMQFYAIFPILLVFFRKFRFFWFSIVIICINLIAKKLLLNLFPMPTLVFFKLDVFLIGILLAMSKRLHDKKDPNYLWSALLGGIILMNISLLISALYALIFAFLFYDREIDPLCIRAFLQKTEWLLSNRLTSFLSDTSYGVYLMHNMFMILVASGFVKLVAYRELPGFAQFLALLLVSGVPVYLISWVSFQSIEMPGIKLGKRLIYKIELNTEQKA